MERAEWVIAGVLWTVAEVAESADGSGIGGRRSGRKLCRRSHRTGGPRTSGGRRWSAGLEFCEPTGSSTKQREVT